MVFTIHTDFTEFQCLFFVPFSHNLDTAKRSMQREEDINTMNNYQLISAVKNGHLDVVNSLIEAGADVNEKNESNNTPLIEAAREGS